MPNGTAAMLELRNVSKSYHRRTVLANVSFQLEAGECMGITGANGSGKSTLLRLIAQAQRPDSGSILFRGRDIADQRQYVRCAMGYVPQDNALAGDLTVKQQLRLWQAARAVREPLAENVMELMGLEPLLPYRVGELSGGMQRRVCIAMALAAGGDLLVMDEATVGLDSTYCQALFMWLAAFLKRGGCVIWCCHRADELERLCSRCLCLREGYAFWGV